MSKLLLYVTMSTLPVFAFFDRADDPARRAERQRETEGAAYDYFKQRLDVLLEENGLGEEDVRKFYLVKNGAVVILEERICELGRFTPTKCRALSTDSQ